MRLHHVVAVVATLLTASQAAAQLSRQELRLEGSAQRVLAVDVDGNGVLELLVFSVSGSLNPERHVSIFALDGNRFGPQARTSWKVDQDAGVFDVGNDPQDGPSLWYCAAGAVGRYRLREALQRTPAAERWLAASSLLGGRSDEWMLFHDFVNDWHGDGRETPAVVQVGRLLLTGADGTQRQELPLRTEIDTTAPPASYEMLDRLPMFLTQRIPSLWHVDATGDGEADLVAALGDRLTIYPKAGGDNYSGAQRDLRFPSSADPRDETRRQAVQLADVTGDGRADAVLSSLTGGFGNLTHEMTVFRGEGQGFAGKALNKLTKNGAASLTSLADLDHDGRSEIVTVTVKIGVQALLSYLLTSRVPIEYDVYRVDNDGEIVPAPMMEWERRVVLQTTGATDPGVVSLSGDFDGDGVDDVVSALDEESIEIRRVVRREGALALGDVFAEVSAPGRGQALAPDLNGDRRADLVVYVPRRAEGVVSVFLSSAAGSPAELRPAPTDHR